MIDKSRIPKEILPVLEKRLEGRSDEIDFPPPVFDIMQGEIVSYDTDKEILINRFPVLSEYLNPYKTLQGGIIATLIDNTIGPLSLIVSPPNFTRLLEVKYGKVVTPDMGFVLVTAQFIEKKKRQLFFKATVSNEDGDKLATAKSTHWVI